MKAKSLGESMKSIGGVRIAVFVLTGICLPVGVSLGMAGTIIIGKVGTLLFLISNLVIAAVLVFIILSTVVLAILALRWSSQQKGDSSHRFKRIYRKSILLMMTDGFFAVTFIGSVLTNPTTSLPAEYLRALFFSPLREAMVLPDIVSYRSEDCECGPTDNSGV